MARVLFVWELGYRLHHIANISAMTRALEGSGHGLGVALRELDRAPQLLSDVKLQYYQAPFCQAPPPRPVKRYGSYAHLLYASGFGDERGLQVLVSAWVGILASFRPDVVVFDHSPAALLASRGFDVRRVVVGSGFAVPPSESPFGVFPDVPRDAETLAQLRSDEQMVLAIANRAVEAHGIAPLERLADLYGDVDARFVLGFPELDPFGASRSDEYLGMWPGPAGRRVAWPDGESPRAFVYLSAFPGIRRVLDALRQQRATALVYAGNLPPGAEEELAGQGLHFHRELADLPRIAEQCDLFVSHGSQTSVCQMLLEGVPQLLIPYYREQELTATCVTRLGAGRSAAWSDGDYSAAAEALVRDGRYREAAARFAAAQRGFDPERSLQRFRERMTKLLD